MKMASQLISIIIVIRLLMIDYYDLLVSPYEMGILDRQPPHNIKRGLMLMSKILQNIANHVEFSKEQHMLFFNDLLRYSSHLSK